MVGWFDCRCTRGCREGDASEDEITAEKSEKYLRVEENECGGDPLKADTANSIRPITSVSTSECIEGTTSEKNIESRDTDSPVRIPSAIPSTAQSISQHTLNTSLCVGQSPVSNGDALRVSTSNGDALPEDVRQVLEDVDRQRITGYHFTAESMVLDLLHRLTTEGRGDIVEQVKDTQVYRDLIAALVEVNKMLQALLDDEGWSLQKEADRIWVWTKPEPGKDQVTVRLAGIVEGPFDYFCSIGKEVGLIKTWMPGVNTSYLVKQLNTFDHIGYYVWKFPFVSAREFLVEEHSVINDAEGYCLVSRQPPVPRDDVQLPASLKGSIRAGISNWYSFSAACGQKSNFVITVMNVDLKIPLPGWLVNRLSINMGYQSFKELRSNVKKAMDPKSELNKSVKDPKNAAYYDRLRSLESIRDKKDMPCREEILKTGWVKDPNDRRKIFSRSGNVLVPL